MRFSTECRIFPSAIHLPGVGGSQPTVPRLEVNLKGENSSEEVPTASSLSLKADPLMTSNRDRVSPEGSFLEIHE